MIKKNRSLTSYIIPKSRMIFWSLLVLIILFVMANLGAVIDLILHPDIEYFDSEHLIVGLTTASVVGLFLIMLIIYIVRLEKSNLEIKQAELLIQNQYKQLQGLNSAKDKFFSIIAHDMRSPFQGLLSLTKIITENDGSISPEELPQLNSEIHKTVNNLFTLLKNLLDWAQMQQGAMNFSPRDYYLSEIIKEQIKIISHTSSKKNISIVNSVSDSIEVSVDEKMISSVFNNLLSNAVKFTKSGGNVIIKEKVIDNNMLEISIIDSGIGIPESISKKLFKIDEKVGRKGTDGEESTGLGLLLCKEFVEKHGGKIWVESTDGKGSTFCFTLPLSKK